MLHPTRCARSVLWRTAKRVTAEESSVSKHAMPLAFYNQRTWKPREVVSGSHSDFIDKLRASFPNGGRGVAMVRNHAPTLRRACNLLAVDDQHRVIARVFFPLCLAPPVNLPPSGLTIDQYAAHIDELRAANRTTFIVVTREEAVGMAMVDTTGNLVEPDVMRTFLSNTQGGHAIGPNNPSRGDKVRIMSATRSIKSQFFVDFHEHVDRHLPVIEQAHAFLLREASNRALFHRIAKTRRFTEAERLPIEQTPEPGQGYKIQTVFHDKRWIDCTAGMLPKLDISSPRGPDINMHGAIGCTRFGVIELA